MKENDEALKVIGKRYMLWNIQRQVYAFFLNYLIYQLTILLLSFYLLALMHTLVFEYSITYIFFLLLLMLKGKTITEEWLIDILDSLEKMQLVEEDNWDTKKYIESEIEQDMIRESKILNNRIRELIK